MGRQRTVKGAYTSDFKEKTQSPKPNMDVKSFAHLDKGAADGTWNAYFAGFSGPVPKSSGKVVQRDRTPPTVETSQDLSGTYLKKPRKRWE